MFYFYDMIPYIDEEYYKLVPRPSKEQRNALKSSIREEGQKEPIVIDSTGKILDGHTRFEICNELGIEVKYTVRDFDTDEEKKNYAITVNLKRRHLNDFQIYELFEKQIEMIKQNNQKERNRNIWKTRRGEKKKNTYDEKVQNSSIRKASEITGLGEGVIEHCRYIKKHGDEKLIQEVRDGKTNSNRAYESLNKITSLNKNKGVTYRSRIGIVSDILKTIKESIDEDVRISVICRKANLSHYLAVEIVNDLLQHGILELKKRKIRGKYYEAKTVERFYLVTEKGNELYSKFLQLYDLLPESMRER